MEAEHGIITLPSLQKDTGKFDIVPYSKAYNSLCWKLKLNKLKKELKFTPRESDINKQKFCVSCFQVNTSYFSSSSCLWKIFLRQLTLSTPLADTAVWSWMI